MRWFVSCPEDSASAPVYLAWLATGGIEGRVLARTFAHPGDLGAFDGLLLAGGPDIAPARYGEATTHPATYGVDPARDAIEIRLFNEFLAAGKPVFGICRGIQLLNVALGGGLLQHVPDALGANAAEVHRRPDGYEGAHAVSVDTATRLGAALAGVTQVNGAHHQAIDPARLGTGLRVVARSAMGIVEAAEMVDAANVCAVQWHPERLPPGHPASRALIEHVRTRA